MKINEIIKTQKEISELGYTVENNMLKSIDVNVIAHFGNTVCFEMYCSNMVPISQHNNTGNIGYLFKALIELLDLSEEDGIRISSIKDVPIRLILTGNSGCGSKSIGFGHFMKDKFVLIEDFVKLDDK